MMWASLPSPSSGQLDLGPLVITAYGLMIALGVVAAVWLFGRRLEQDGSGSREDARAIGTWGVVSGVVGARLYHVATDWQRYQSDLGSIVEVWNGGLGIPGGMLAGVVAGVVVARRRGLVVDPALAAAVPALPLAQAIGRWGNWFNQELFGMPTMLPWALRIDDAHLPAGSASGTTFHPAFLYESLWNLALCGVLLRIDHRLRPTGRRLLAMYVLGYGSGRFWIERLRIDPAPHLGIFRWNQWVALACIVGGGAYLLITAGTARRPPAEVLTTAEDDPTDDQAFGDAADQPTAGTNPH